MNNSELYKKYLPIGTVVLLEGGEKRLMINGFCVVPNEDPSKVYDYSGCLYPEGVLSTDAVALFNHDQIKEVCYLGFVCDEEKAFKTMLDDLVSEVDGDLSLYLKDGSKHSSIVSAISNSDELERL